MAMTVRTDRPRPTSPDHGVSIIASSHTSLRKKVRGSEILPVIVIGTAGSGLGDAAYWLQRLGVHLGDSYAVSGRNAQAQPWRDQVWAEFHRRLVRRSRFDEVDAGPDLAGRRRDRFLKIVGALGAAKDRRASDLGANWWALIDTRTPYFLDLYREAFPDAVFLNCDRSREICIEQIRRQYPEVSEETADRVNNEQRRLISDFLARHRLDSLTLNLDPPGESGPEAIRDKSGLIRDSAWLADSIGPVIELGDWLDERWSERFTNPAVRPKPSTTGPLSRESDLPIERLIRPIFVIAHIRSGSSLLYDTMRESGSLWSWQSEGRVFWEYLSQLRAENAGYDSDRLLARDATQAVREHAAKSMLVFGKDRQELPCLATPRRARQPEFRFYTKYPADVLRVPFLNELFPDALFVHLVRQGFANVSSAIEAWRTWLPGMWSTPFPADFRIKDFAGSSWMATLIPGWRELNGKTLDEVCAHQFATASQIAMDDLEALGEPSRILRVSFEDLVAHPRDTISTICQFADIDFDDYLQKKTMSPLQRSYSVISAPEPDKWRLRLSPESIDRIAPIVEPIMDRLGMEML